MALTPKHVPRGRGKTLRRAKPWLCAGLAVFGACLAATGPARTADPECEAGAEGAPGDTNAMLACVEADLRAALALSGVAGLEQVMDWPRYATAPYVSAGHGERYVLPLADEAAAAFGQFQNVGRMPTGARLALPSFSLNPAGTPVAGPVFLMEKMEPGFAPGIRDWRYAMVLPDGSTFTTTSTPDADALRFCAGCHLERGRRSDSMIYPPPELRPTP